MLKLREGQDSIRSEETTKLSGGATSSKAWQGATTLIAVSLFAVVMSIPDVSNYLSVSMWGKMRESSTFSLSFFHIWS